MKTACLILLLCCWHGVPAATVDGFTQKLGARLPLNAEFRNEQGQPHRLGDFFSREPVIIVLGYYHCPRLCSTVMDGVLQSVQGLGLPYSIVGISIDPDETPAVAARKHAAYVASDPNAQTRRLHLLTGGKHSIAQVARQLGFGYHYDRASGQYTHPAGFIIATADGRVSRYFPGIRFETRDVRLALVEASSNRIGTLSERLVLLCSHYDPLQGRYSIAVMRLVRILGILIMAALAFGIWYFNRRTRRAG
jgi:protein SCO1/2